MHRLPHAILIATTLLAAQLVTGPGHAATYDLEIGQTKVNFTGDEATAFSINGTTPGPLLRFRQGEEVTLNVTNTLDEPASIHWHGLLVPPKMDGVPGISFDGIAPGATFTYRFTLRQAGTYWYHSHSGYQEQRGVYGPMIVEPAGQDPITADRDYVVLLSDWLDEDPAIVHANLKASSDYYNYAQRTVFDFFRDVAHKGLSATLADRKMWGEMRMTPTDLSDVSGYTFLVNGKPVSDPWSAIFKPGERVRLRFINGSAMSYFDVRIPGLKMQVVQADGQNIEPVPVDEFRIAVAETYDVIVTPTKAAAYTIVAESTDRTGFALASLAADTVEPRIDVPNHRPRALLTMADMSGMDMGGMDMSGGDRGGMDMSNMDMSGMNHPDHAAMGHTQTMTAPSNDILSPPVGAPAGAKVLSYSDLKAREPNKDLRPPEREVIVRLGGNMERYIWTINGKKFEDAEPIMLRYGERVRLTFINETMMNHPMHLHGMFVELENGQKAPTQPRKHVVNIGPGRTYSATLTADEAGEWAFHCHLLYHMASGMFRKVIVAKTMAEVL